MMSDQLYTLKCVHNITITSVTPLYSGVQNSIKEPDCSKCKFSNLKLVKCPNNECNKINQIQDTDNYRVGSLIKCFNCSTQFQTVCCKNCSNINYFTGESQQFSEGYPFKCYDCNQLNYVCICPNCLKPKYLDGLSFGKNIKCDKCLQFFAMVLCPQNQCGQVICQRDTLTILEQKLVFRCENQNEPGQYDYFTYFKCKYDDFTIFKSQTPLDQFKVLNCQQKNCPDQQSFTCLLQCPYCIDSEFYEEIIPNNVEKFKCSQTGCNQKFLALYHQQCRKLICNKMNKDSLACEGCNLTFQTNLDPKEKDPEIIEKTVPICKACQEETATYLNEQCQHLCYCQNCYDQIKKNAYQTSCPMCRKNGNWVQIFM